MRTLYSILDASPSDSLVDLKKAYHRAALKFHPDKTNATNSDWTSTNQAATVSTTSDSTLDFDRLTKAWRILSDPDSRRRYDSWLREQQLREETAVLFDTIDVEQIPQNWTLISDDDEDDDRHDSESTHTDREDSKSTDDDRREQLSKRSMELGDGSKSTVIGDGSKENDDDGEREDEINRSYLLDCRCGGSYVFDTCDWNSYETSVLYILCSNCSLSVKIVKA